MKMDIPLSKNDPLTEEIDMSWPMAVAVAEDVVEIEHDEIEDGDIFDDADIDVEDFNSDYDYDDDIDEELIEELARGRRGEGTDDRHPSVEGLGLDRMDQEESSGGEEGYKVLTTAQIIQQMIECIQQGNSILHLPPTTMRLLYTHFGWDKGKLMEAFCDRDHDQLFREAGVVDGNISEDGNGNAASGEAVVAGVSGGGGVGVNDVEECEICCTRFLSSDMFGLKCGHRFCIECWETYLATKIVEEGIGQIITCAAHSCLVYVDDASVMRLIKDPNVKLKYQHLITNSFVQSNRLMRWCPSPGCTNAILAQSVDCQPVTCDCGHTFCFSCAQDLHAPVKCSWLKKWLEKSQSDAGNSKWISANTKSCPKCSVNIEKNGGCNRILCTNLNCRFNFCWLCMGPWEVHGYDPCNRYDPSKLNAEESTRDKSRADLTRYVFYFDRFMGHKQSLKLESTKLYNSVEVKMAEMQTHNLSWIEAQFLKKAVDILCECRKTLMYSYVFAFYLKPNNESAIFEGNQKDLQNATETLSEYLERDITEEELDNIRTSVQDKYRYCEGRRKALLEHVEEGYENDRWVYDAE